MTCRVLAADTGREAPEDGVSFYRRAGWDHEAIEFYRTRFGGFGKGVCKLPDGFRRIPRRRDAHDRQHAWRVIVGTGHSP
jgi:hypothetical protein